ncbi:ATP-binding protein [Granulicella sp. WH15]|uniref:sensor histidine kinase n=1 Tax=Granulicella sp. WH15 TaxID=2602070 RepID=UPI002104EB51|nr:ATP-binding protein [Granulicella sp. WH15]
MQELSNAPGVSTNSGEGIVPLRTGVRPTGVLILRGVTLSLQTLEAIGSLISVSLDRASAVDEVAHSAATQESERFRSAILDSITHELRTPLTSIKCSVVTLLASATPRAEEHTLLTVIDQESDRLNRLITEAIEIAQLDSQQTNMTLAPSRIEAIISSAVASTRERLSGREIVVRTAPSLPTLILDRVRIEKVVSHLLENAAKYSDAGKPIFISAELSGRFVACSVADRGIGIDPSEQVLVFNKLYRARNRAAESLGSGMGLAISRAIVEAHGGSIAVTSQLGEGSVFTFLLPIPD